MKKLIKTAVGLSIVSLFALSSCSKKSGSAAAENGGKEGKVLNIAVWNEEFQDRFKNYFEQKKEDMSENNSGEE